MRSSLFLTLVTLFAVHLPADLSAREVRVPYSNVAAYTLKNNPALAAARLRIEEAKGRLIGAGRLANPELGIDFKRDDRFYEGTFGVSFDQKFPVTARLRLEKVVAQKEIRAAELEVREAERKMIAEARPLAVKLLSLDQQRTLRQQQADLALKLSDFAAKRAQTGEISALDAAQAQVDAQRILLEGRQLETERTTLLGQLKPMLGVRDTDSLAITGSLPAMTNGAPKGNWESRPDYLLSKVHEDAARSQIELARSKKWEDWTVGALFEHERSEDAPEGLDKTPFFGVRVSIPLPFWNKNEGEVVEKSAAARRAELETKALAFLIRNEAAAARSEMNAYAKLSSETKEKLLPLVLEQTDKLEKAYQSGQTDLLTVLRAREQRLQLEAAVLNATRDYHLARIRYEAATNSGR
ncbi:cobalt-zinc-cadmium efflux system outer membrane protein [Roseimicrobium gellanilyticum]|uniref:Cobalt-zinc-cadmium efflux system outer membrane protein n=1 Tax=Roseimicrobium gellanilyticum TaxID=748857 RepID=A0A366HJA8_9BACT|nr:TolC family protein [Roseimicrobium gellanilyticum]RBP42455.1 cobalt-zinc-cadmium efflux system outer membrane protein [Roseimicrobium gellanilyticum]